MENPIFTRRVSAGTRIYYFDVRCDQKGQHYLSISEIPTDKNKARKERQRIFIHTEDMPAFVEAVTESALKMLEYAG